MINKQFCVTDVTEPKKFSSWYRRLYDIVNCDTDGLEGWEENIESKVVYDNTASPGSLVEVHWNGEDLEGCIDSGYIFTLPTMDNDDIFMSGIVHIPRPSNPGGIGDVEPLWMFIGDLCCLPDIDKVIIKGRKE